MENSAKVGWDVPLRIGLAIDDSCLEVYERVPIVDSKWMDGYGWVDELMGQQRCR
jgi:hypothetical protein